MKGQGLHRRLSAFVVLLGIVRCAGTDRAPTCNSSHDPGMVEPVIIGGIGDSGSELFVPCRSTMNTCVSLVVLLENFRGGSTS
jgi:hypothetical protein